MPELTHVETAAPGVAPTPSGTSAHDVVYAFSFITWRSAAERGRCFPEDRLAASLVEHGRVARLLVADPFRSLPVKLVRAALARDAPAFPASPTRRLHAPVRLRRFDPVEPAAAARACRAYERRLRRAAAAMGLERPALITANPLLAGFGRFDWTGPVTYYAWDDWTASLPHERWWPAYREAFARLRAERRRVCAVSDEVMARVAPTAARAVVPNGIEEAEWLELPAPPAWFTARPRPRLLYIGSLDARLDVEQLRRVAAAWPEGSLTLVGPVLDPAHLAPLRGVPGVELRPRAPRSEVAALIGAADACLIPHVRNALTESMSPLKLYEYLAGGRPVAAVDLAPIARVDPRVALAPAGGDFAGALRRALALGPAPEPERLRFVRANAWRHRHDQLLDLALAVDAPSRPAAAR